MSSDGTSAGMNEVEQVTRPFPQLRCALLTAAPAAGGARPGVRPRPHARVWIRAPGGRRGGRLLRLAARQQVHGDLRVSGGP